ncbi:hypothetical protein AKJ16_DCAP09091 [Drosera capensis]
MMMRLFGGGGYEILLEADLWLCYFYRNKLSAHDFFLHHDSFCFVHSALILILLSPQSSNNTFTLSPLQMAMSITFTSTRFPISSSLHHSPHFPFPVTISTTVSHFPFATPTIHSHGSFLTRRLLLLPSVSGIWDAITGGGNNNNSARDAIIAIRRGMQLFREGDVAGAVLEFDRAIELDPRQKAYLWQRGLSLYYLNRFEEGAEQFRLDVAQNPNDTEEAIWCFLCEAPLYGVDEARKRFLKASYGQDDKRAIPAAKAGVVSVSIVEGAYVWYIMHVIQVGRDRRDVMREVYTLFKDGGDTEKLVAAFSSNRDGEYFYASLYAGLYYESQKNPDAARRHLVAACQSPYAQRSDDYMASLGKVHCLLRGWSTDQNTL